MKNPRLSEEKLHQFKISNITRKAKEKGEKPTPKLISATYCKSKKYLELLFEVESFELDNKHVNLQGKKVPLSSGYAVLLRYEDIPEDFDIKDKDSVVDIIASLDVKVHCDCPAFYWQGMYESDDIEDNARYKFSSTRGTGVWDLRHAAENGEPGKALCKHLSVVQDWLLDDFNNFWTAFQSKRKQTESAFSPFEVIR